MIVAGTDVSGYDSHEGQHKIISIVIGPEEDIGELHGNIGIKKIHMKDLKRTKRDKVKKSMTFKSDRILGLSLVVGKNRIVHGIHENQKTKERFASIGAIFAYFDHLLLEKIRPEIDEFLNKFDASFKEIQFQCDTDMHHTLKNWKARTGGEGKAHELADGLAYLCRAGYAVPYCQRHDFEGEIEKQMRRELIR